MFLEPRHDALLVEHVFAGQLVEEVFVLERVEAHLAVLLAHQLRALDWLHALDEVLRGRDPVLLVHRRLYRLLQHLGQDVILQVHSPEQVSRIDVPSEQVEQVRHSSRGRRLCEVLLRHIHIAEDVLNLRNPIVNHLSDHLHALRRRAPEKAVQDILDIVWIIWLLSPCRLLLLLLLLLWHVVVYGRVVEVLLVNLNFEIDNLF